MFSSFFETPLPFFGLDLSDRSMKLARVSRASRAPKITGLLEREVPLGLYLEGRVKDPRGLAEFLRDTLAGRGAAEFRVPYVVASIPEGYCFIRVIQLPEIPDQEIAKALPWETEGVIPLSYEQAYIDWRVIGRSVKTVGTPAEGKPHVDVLIAAVDREIVDEHADVFLRAGIIPAAFEPESVATSRAFFKAGVSYPPVLVIDLGGSRTALTIISGQSLRVTASIQISSTAFTERISRELKISFADAEERKRRFGIMPEGPGQENFEAVTPLLADLTEQLKGYLEYYRTHAFHEHDLYTLTVQVSGSAPGTFDFRPIARGEIQIGRPSGGEGTAITSIVLAGGGSVMPGFAEYLMGALGVPVKRGDPFSNIAVVSKSERENPESVRYATALGLAMHPLRESLKLT